MSTSDAERATILANAKKLAAAKAKKIGQDWGDRIL